MACAVCATSSSFCFRFRFLSASYSLCPTYPKYTHEDPTNNNNNNFNRENRESHATPRIVAVVSGPGIGRLRFGSGSVREEKCTRDPETNAMSIELLIRTVMQVRGGGRSAAELWAEASRAKQRRAITKERTT